MRAPQLPLLLALLACSASSQPLRGPMRSGPYSLELVDDGGNLLQTFAHRGRIYALGSMGQRYAIRITNNSGERVEAVASVDGRDVVDGRAASFSKRGYLIEPHGSVTIDGFRVSDAAVAAFRFGDVSQSYAAQMGNARDVGVIGVAIFGELPPPPPPPPEPLPDFEDRASSANQGQGGAASAAPSAPAPSAGASVSREAAKSRAQERPGLGTEFGEERGSQVYSVSFQRRSSRPEVMLTLRYDDRPGLLALGIDVDGLRVGRADERWLRETAEPFRGNPGYSRPPPGWRR